MSLLCLSTINQCYSLLSFCFVLSKNCLLSESFRRSHTFFFGCSKCISIKRVENSTRAPVVSVPLDKKAHGERSFSEDILFQWNVILKSLTQDDLEFMSPTTTVCVFIRKVFKFNSLVIVHEQLNIRLK